MFVALAVAGTVGALFALVTMHVLVGQTVLERDTLEGRVGAQRVAIERLELERAAARSPLRIERLALELGLVHPDEVLMLDASAPTRAAAGASPSPARGDR